MLALTAFIVALGIIVLIIQLIKSYNNIEKILYLNAITNLGALLIVIMSSTYNTRYLIDIAIIYFILNFISSIAYLRFYSSIKKSNIVKTVNNSKS